MHDWAFSGFFRCVSVFLYSPPSTTDGFNEWDGMIYTLRAGYKTSGLAIGQMQYHVLTNHCLLLKSSEKQMAMTNNENNVTDPQLRRRDTFSSSASLQTTSHLVTAYIHTALIVVTTPQCLPPRTTLSLTIVSNRHPNINTSTPSTL